jgi:hypothetical protein
MSDVSLPAVVIGRRDGDHVSINVLGRLHPGAVDASDGNWLMTPIEVSVPGFKTEIGASPERGGAAGVQASPRGLRGVARRGGCARVDGVADHASGIRRPARAAVRFGEATESLGSGNGLVFRVRDLDQSDLPGVIAALQSVNDAFPVVGES